MKVTTISCKKVFSTGVMYEPEHIGMEAELDPGEDPVKAYSELRAIVMHCGPSLMNYIDTNSMSELEKEKIRKGWNEMSGKRPDVYDGPPLKPTNDEPLRFHAPKDKNEQKAQIIADIQTCTELKVLESYKILAKNDPDIQKAYDEKKEELEFYKLTPEDIMWKGVIERVRLMDVGSLKDGEVININPRETKEGDFGIDNKRKIYRYGNGIWFPLKS